jgi:hypothetical protein
MRRLLLALALVGCGADESITGGTWRSDAQTLSFTADRYHMQNLQPASAEDGTWATDADGLHLVPDVGLPYPAMRWAIHGDELTIVWPPARTYRK